MNTRKQMIIAKGNIVTSDVKSCKYNRTTRKWDIVFNSGKLFCYSYDNVSILRDPEILNPSLYKIEHLGRELFNIEAIYVFKDRYDSYWHICFQDSSERSYRLSDLGVIKSCLSEKISKNVFDYLQQTAEMVSVKSEDGTNLLSKQYEKISDFVGDDTALALYLNPKGYKNAKIGYSNPIFPFGCNASQYAAVKNALENQVSIIQGPPGTGKTQTILNIIANLLVSGKTVQVVSNNNSATANVLEKLSNPKYDMGFVVASLGSTKNKESFINKQTGSYPDMSLWNQESDIVEMREEISRISYEMSEIFQNKERLALLKQQLQDLNLEKRYFDLYIEESDEETNKLKTKRNITSKKILKALNEAQITSEKKDKISWHFILKYFFVYGIFVSKAYNSIFKLIAELQNIYYIAKESEIIKEIREIEELLTEKNAEKLLELLTDKSMKLLKKVLFSKYGNKQFREIFTLDDLWKEHQKFLAEYPVVLSTTFSSRSSVYKSAKFDYVIIDEASQVDVSTGALALSCAKNVVIVGDSKQLPNVVTDDIGKRNDVIFEGYKIDESYRFSKNSFLESVCNIIKDIPQTLLREHYRCHPKIIGFCNQKFYGGQLIVMTEDNNEEDTLSVFKTVKGEHVRDFYSQRQVDVITEEVMPEIIAIPKEIGIIAPYNNQVAAVKKAIKNNDIDVATVHKFQGREKDVIILTTVDDEIGVFVDDPDLLNVAVSRAKRKLVLVVTGNDIPDGSNIKDLISYIEYNNFSIKQSNIRSVFDFLYKEYTESRLEYLKKSKKVSEYDSENLMHKLITEILQMDEFIHLSVISHQPLNTLLRNLECLDTELRMFASCELSHLDFLIYNRVTKAPVLAIEVDGWHNHKIGTLQYERDKKKNRIMQFYNIPLIRLATNGSSEKEKVIEKLHSLNELTV